MTDILVRPAANADTSLTNAFVIDDAALPLSAEDAVALGMTLGTEYEFQVLGASATLTVTGPPSAFVDANWSVATGASTGAQLDVTISSLPAANGSAITDVQYDINASGTWISSGGTTSFTISSGLTADTLYSVRLRAVNANGNSPAGNAESATSSAAGASFTEEATTADGTAYIRSGAARLPSAPGVLVFASHAPSTDLRAMLMHWASASNGSDALNSDFGGPTTPMTIGPRFAVTYDATGTVTAITSPAPEIALNDRVNVLFYAKVNGDGTYSMHGWQWITGGGAATEPVSTGGVGNTTINLGVGELTLCRRRDNNQNYSGNIYRLAMWTFADAANVPDVSLQTVRDNFFDNTTGTLVDPATSYAALTGATLQFDLYTTAMFNDPTTAAGRADLVAALTKTGTFT